MKHLFFLNESEKDRIINMHQNATKKYYLKESDEINENAQQTGEYKIQSNVYFLENASINKSELKLFRGTTFKKEPNSERLIAKTKYQYVDTDSGNVVKSSDDQTNVSRDEERTYTFNGTVTYLCQAGKFVTDTSKGNQFFDEEGSLTKELKLACAFKGQGTPTTTTQQTQVQQNAIKCGWKNQDGSADVEGYKNSGWKCPTKSGDKKTSTGVAKINTPSDADLDKVLQQLG